MKINENNVWFVNIISDRHPIPTSYIVANGISKMATSRSDTASETISKFEGVLSLRTIATAVQTSMLPRIVPATISPHIVTITTIVTGPCESSSSDRSQGLSSEDVVQFVEFMITPVGNKSNVRSLRPRTTRMSVKSEGWLTRTFVDGGDGVEW